MAQVCNSYLPADSALSRLIFVVDFLTNNGFYVVLSNNLEVRVCLTFCGVWLPDVLLLFVQHVSHHLVCMRLLPAASSLLLALTELHGS